MRRSLRFLFYTNECVGLGHLRRTISLAQAVCELEPSATSLIITGAPFPPKRTCEDLADVYRTRGLEAVALRYFTVYGPRQRPDMAMRRLCEALIGGAPFPLFGDGSQSRDFTHVDDAVAATVRAGVTVRPAPVYNIGGGEEATLAEVISILESLAGRRVLLDRRGAQDGDVRRTGADTSLARSSLGWRPTVSLRDGLRSELDWVRAHAVARNGRENRLRPVVVGHSA